MHSAQQDENFCFSHHYDIAHMSPNFEQQNFRHIKKCWFAPAWELGSALVWGQHEGRDAHMEGTWEHSCELL